ncbi:hypothetical protein FOZ63_025220, partial [Perkinsus olseni]
ALLVLLTEESSAAGIWGFHERLASKSSARPPRYWRDGVRLLVSLLGLPPTTAAEEEYPDGPASSCSLATPSAMDLQRAPAVVTVIDEPWEPPPCECSEDVEDLIDRIGVLRREREYRDSALALVHGRAEWLWVASSGLFQPTGFITTKEKEALDKVAAYINQDGRCGRGSSSSSMSREEDFARPLGDFIKPVGSPPVYEVVPLDPLLSPSDWAVMVADDIENMVAKGCRSPIPVEAEIFFVCELSSLVIASYSPDDPSKDPVYGSALRLVWAIGCVLSIWVNLDDPNNYPFNAQVWSALGYISFRMGHYDIAAHSYLEARDCREAYAMYKGKEHKVCPHIATAYHNAGASFMQMGRDREAFAFLGVAMEAFSDMSTIFDPSPASSNQRYPPERKYSGSSRASVTQVKRPYPQTDFSDPNLAVRTLMVFRFPREAQEVDLACRFGRFGPLEHVKVVYDPVTHLPRCYGFVRFVHRSHALEAYQACEEQKISMDDPFGRTWFFEVKWARNARAAGEIPRGPGDQPNAYNGGYAQSPENPPPGGIPSDTSPTAVPSHPAIHDSIVPPLLADNSDDFSPPGLSPSAIEPALLELASYEEDASPMMSSEEAQELLRQLENAQQSDMSIAAATRVESVSPFELPEVVRDPPTINHFIDIASEAEETATSQAAAAAAAAALASKTEHTSQDDLALLMETVFKTVRRSALERLRKASDASPSTRCGSSTSRLGETSDNSTREARAGSEAAMDEPAAAS